MKLTNLRGALQQAMEEMFARNRLHFGAGGPDYYGVEVVNVADDGSRFDFVLTFKSGTRYCCMELGCHFPFARGGAGKAKWAQRIRQRLASPGLSPLGPITINNVHVIVEEGAIFDTGRNRPQVQPRRFEYDSGPFYENDSVQ